MYEIIALVFIIGYLLIVFEHKIRIDKAVTALLTGIVLWTLIATDATTRVQLQETDLAHVLGEISAILFFLLGAMTIVELVDLHHGFKIIAQWIGTKNKFVLLVLICFISFFLSAILDNLTTTIVMISILRKILTDPEDRLWFASFIVIAANSGGAWSPIGDITTTMLWIDHKVSSIHLIQNLILPSLLSILVPLILISKQQRFRETLQVEFKKEELHVSSKFYLLLGTGLLIMVPVFKTLTNLPPYMGMMGALGIIWLVSEIHHPYMFPVIEPSKKPTVQRALSRIEIPSILFFFGILLAISALETVGQLEHLGDYLSSHFQDPAIIAFILGILSAMIDNVPLVAGAMAMYDYPIDDIFWHQLAFAAGTGGSILIIGSAAGVAAMGLEKINYIWYLKRISILALIGYLAGWGYFFIES